MSNNLAVPVPHLKPFLRVAEKTTAMAPMRVYPLSWRNWYLCGPMTRMKLTKQMGYGAPSHPQNTRLTRRGRWAA